MERYFILVFYGLSAEERTFLWKYFGSEDVTANEQHPSSKLPHRLSYVYLLNVKKRWEKHIEWKKIDTTRDILQLISNCFEDVCEDIKNEDVWDSNRIADCINSLADHLPLPGTFVLDLLVGCNIFENFTVSDNVEFAASLLRLSEWHSARCLALETKVTSNFKEWVELTKAEVTDISTFSKLTHPFWRGAIEFKDPNTPTQCYKGFELSIDSENNEMHHFFNLIFNEYNASECLLLHSNLKALDVCCFSSIPQHLILPVFMKLCVSGNDCYDSSRKLCANIKEKNAALILRMGYSILKEKPKSDKILSTSKWLKMVSSGNVKLVSEPESPEKYLTLAVVPLMDGMFTVAIRDTSCLDAQFYFSAVSMQNKLSSISPGTGVKVGDFSVPFVSKALFLSSLQKTMSLHAASNKSDTCVNLLSDVTSELLTSFIHCIHSSELVNFSDVNTVCDEVDPSDWVERINLLQKQLELDEKKKNKRNLFMSFSPKRSRYYVSFSGDDIKKYFEPSGEAKASDKVAEPIQSLYYYMNYNKDNLETVLQTNWPDILNCVYDDIYYNVTKQSEENENIGNEMVKCYVQHETASTCNNHQSQPEAPISVQAKCMTPRKRPKSRGKSSFRQIFTKPDAAMNEELSAEVQSNPVISTIMKTLGVSKSSNADPNAVRKRIPRKNSIPVRCSPRKKSPIEYYSKRHNSTNQVQKSKTSKEKGIITLSEILKKKLRSSIACALESNGVNIEDVLFKPCFKRLFTICQAFVQDIQCNPRKLGTSQYIQEIAEEHVKPVIKFEKQKKKIK